MHALPLGEEGISADFCFVLSILIVATWMTGLFTFRSYQRKKQRITAESHIYLVCNRFDIFYLSYASMYICILLWAVAVYSATNNKVIIILAFLLPTIILFFLRYVIAFQKNEYFFLQNIKKLNTRIDRHNKKLAALKVKSEQLIHTMETD